MSDIAHMIPFFRMKYSFLFLLSLFISSLVQAEALSPVSQDADRAIQGITQKVQTLTLSNGLQIIGYQRGIAPIFTGMILVRAGGVDEISGKTGISHMLEHMAFKGTAQIGTKDYVTEKSLLQRENDLMTLLRERPLEPFEEEELRSLRSKLTMIWNTEEFSKLLEIRGAVNFNAQTDKETTKYFVSLPRDAFEFWCWIESERLIHPIMRQFYLERDVVLEERRLRVTNDPSGELYENLLLKAFTKHPYRNPVIGYQGDIEKLTADELEQFRKIYYVPSNIVVSIAGDIDLQSVRPLLEKYFGRIPKGKKPSHQVEEEPQQSQEQEVVLQRNTSALLSVGYHKPTYPHPQDPAISLLEEILAGSSLSPLYDELVKKRQIALTVSVEETPGLAYPNLFLFSLAPRAPYTNKDLLLAFDEVLGDFMKRGPTDEEMNNAKKAISMQYLGELRSNTSLADSLGYSQLMYGDWTAMLDWYSQTMKVTKEEVQQAAVQYLIRSNRIIGRMESES